MSIPLALAAFDLPGEAMETSLRSLRAPSTRILAAAAPAVPRTAAPEPGLTIFTSPEVARRFFPPRALQRPLTLDVFREQYFQREIPFGSIIHREALKNRLAPELVAAMVHTESDFRPGLVSNRSAQGLMQIVPGTARILGVSNPFDPEENIAAGTRYFRYLLERFDDESMALAAYNAGEGNVTRFGGIPPFDETRTYVAKVNRRASRYREGIRRSYLTTRNLREAR